MVFGRHTLLVGAYERLERILADPFQWKVKPQEHRGSRPR